MPWPVHPTGFFGAQGDNDTYRIERSLRFNSADSAYLNRTLGTPTSQSIFTFSCWVKRSTLSSSQPIFSNSSGTEVLYFKSTDALEFYKATTSYTTTAVFRDVSAWGHLVFSSNSGTIKLYWNGVEFLSSSVTPASLNSNGVTHYIGRDNVSYFSGYITEINFIDGQALTPSSFGETDAITGRWKAKAYSGTYGTNGFYLKFADNSGTTATTLGKDSSGNGNNWTPNNFSVTAGAGNDSLLDSPTNSGDSGNYCVCNRLNSNASSITNGNLDFIGDTGSSFALGVIGTFSVSSGKWYFESTVNVVGTASFIGVIPSTFSGTANSDLEYADGAYSYRNNGDKANGTGDIFSAYGNSYTTNDVIGVAVDLDNGAIYFSKNGTWQNLGVPTSGSSKTGAAFISFSGGYSPMACGYGGASHSLNFGQRPFAYTAPTGFKALCTTNLPTPTIKKPSSYMDVVTYTGNGSTQTISGFGFSPDLVWIKSRSGAYHHRVYDTTRGVTKVLYTSLTDAEVTVPDANDNFVSFNSNGFTLGSTASTNGLNENSQTFVAWAWDEAPIAGMDIVSSTSNGSGTLVFNHNLGVTPSFIIYKRRDGTGNWVSWNKTFTSSEYLNLNLTSAKTTYSGLWSIASSSVTVIDQAASSSHIAYLFAEVEGFSKFGSYTGNGSSDGPFVWCGFRPRYLLVKRTDASESWIIFDTARETINDSNRTILYAESSSAEQTDAFPTDIISNGFKIRNAGTGANTSGGTYIFAAFAESPFKYARAR